MDDIHHLKRIGTEQSFLFLVDSAKRDKTAFPTASEYEVEFKAPFRNVIGLDLIDATVARTEYIVESGQNTLVYTARGTKQTVSVPPGDYNHLQLVAVLQEAVGTDLTVAHASSPPEISNKVVFRAYLPFTIHASESGLCRALGLGNRSVLEAAEVVPGAMGLQTTLTVPSIPASTVSAATAIRQFLEVPIGTLTKISFYASSTSPVAIQIALVDADTTLAFEGVVMTSGAAMELLEFVVPQGIPTSQFQTCVLKGGAEVFSTGQNVRVGQGAPIDGQWWKYASWSNPFSYDSVYLETTVDADGYEASPPDLVCLTGEPYVLIRCPEIEGYLFRDRACENLHPGMGLVKLANYGFREQRYDFASFPPRKLPTPVSKINRLTIRLEKPGGGLYGTKGIDHHLVFVLRYLDVVERPTGTKSMLNPHYDPGMLIR